MAQLNGVDEHAWQLPEWCNIVLPTSITGSEEYSVPVKIHYLLFAVPALSCLSALVAGGGAGAFFLALSSSGPLLYLAVLIHEVGHLIAAAQCGSKPQFILLWPMGGLAVTADAAGSPKDRAYVSAAGPATHIPMFCIWCLFCLMAMGEVTLSTRGLYTEGGFSMWFSLLCIHQLLMNLIMFLFNACVPCFPLDCSSIIMNTALMYDFDKASIAYGMVASSCPLILGMAIWGLIDIFTTGQGVVTLLVAAWLGSQTYQLYTAYSEESLDQHALFQSASQQSQSQHCSNGGRQTLDQSTLGAAAPGLAPGGVGMNGTAANVDLSICICLALVWGVR